MSTRTTGKRETLEPTSELECRCRHRMHQSEGTASTYDHVRAELQRVARQVRKLKTQTGQSRCVEIETALWAHNEAIDLVLALLKEAEK